MASPLVLVEPVSPGATWESPPATRRRGIGNRRANAADDAATVARKDRRARALELRVFGASLDQIARELGVGRRQAKRDIQRAIAERGAEAADECRAILNAQLDQDRVRMNRLLAPLVRMAEGDAERGVAPNPKAAIAAAHLVGRKTRIAEAQMRLNGAEAPARVEHAHAVEVSGAIGMVMASMTDERIASLLERARERKRLADLAVGLMSRNGVTVRHSEP